MILQPDGHKSSTRESVTCTTCWS